MSLYYLFCISKFSNLGGRMDNSRGQLMHEDKSIFSKFQTASNMWTSSFFKSANFKLLQISGLQASSNPRILSFFKCASKAPYKGHLLSL